MVFDECPPYTKDKKIKESMNLSTRWAKRSKPLVAILIRCFLE